MASVIVVADTSVLINFLRLDRMDLIGNHPDSFVATEHVAAEILDPDQRNRYTAALSAGCLDERPLRDPVEVELFLRLAGWRYLGAGERSAIAFALSRNCRLAMQDRRAIERAKQVAQASGKTLSIARTEDIVVELMKARHSPSKRPTRCLSSGRTVIASNSRSRLLVNFCDKAGA